MCTEKEKSRFAFTVNAYYTIGPGIERTESFTPSDGALLVAIVDEAGFSSLQKQESLPTALLHKDKNIRMPFSSLYISLLMPLIKIFC